jgi:uncharacterized membrane protein
MKKNEELQDYIQRLKTHLKPLPPSEQQEIVHEIESHLREGVKHGKPLDALLTSLGSPAELAKGYIGEYYLSQSPTRPSVWLKKMVFFSTAGMTSPVITVFLGGTSAAFALAAALVLIAGLLRLFGAAVPFNIGTYEVPRLLSPLVAIIFSFLLGKIALYFHGKLQAHFQAVYRRYRRLFSSSSQTANTSAHGE